MNTPAVLLVIHQKSGTGHDAAQVAALQHTLLTHWDGARSLVVARNHAEVASTVTQFLRLHPGRVLVVAGGGSGTLRNVVNAVVEDGSPLDGTGRVSISALRMGSGNLAARWFDVPKDSNQALCSILANAAAHTWRPCKILRLSSEDGAGNPWTQHATGMVGCGILGRVPSDVKSIKRNLPWMHQAAAAMAGLENVNRAEYAGAFVARTLRSFVRPRRLERVRVVQRGEARSFRLVAGAAMTGPVPGMELPNSPSVDSAEAGIHFLPLGHGSAPGALAGALDASTMEHLEQLRLTPGFGVDVELLDRNHAEVFADEDPFTAHRHFLVELAGFLPFVPGNTPSMEAA
jgi:diacylglycerol kinase family enzyme